MSQADAFDIFLVTAPGLEEALADEARALGFSNPQTGPGGVTVRGNWREVWRANLHLRGAARIMARIGGFHANHLAQLDKLSRRFQWARFLRPDIPLRVEASCRKSRIYHEGAAAERVSRAINEELGAPISAEAELRLLVRIDHDHVQFSLDTSGEALHKRGHKEAVNKAPMRENMAALFLRQCGYQGQETVVDPMCGSGTFIIEAAEIARGLAPGRSRRFAFESLAGFDQQAWESLRSEVVERPSLIRFYGSDRDGGAIAMSRANAERAGVADACSFERLSVTDARPPEGPPGVVIVNPPYGGRIGDRKRLSALYAAFGSTLRAQFTGWRAGVITSEPALAKATGLVFDRPGPPVSHGGLKVRLFYAQSV